MFLEEYDQELHFRTLKREGFEDGFEAGFNDGFSDGFNDGFNDGFSDGVKSGTRMGEEQIKKINTLTRLLIHDGRTEDLLRCTSDPEFQKQLFKEYDLD